LGLVWWLVMLYCAWLSQGTPQQWSAKLAEDS